MLVALEAPRRPDRSGAHCATRPPCRTAQQTSCVRSPSIYPRPWETWQTRFNPVGVGVDVERQLVIYYRWASVPGGVENVVVLLKFSDTQQVVNVPFSVQGR